MCSNSLQGMAVRETGLLFSVLGLGPLLLMGQTVAWVHDWGSWPWEYDWLKRWINIGDISVAVS